MYQERSTRKNWNRLGLLQAPSQGVWYSSFVMLLAVLTTKEQGVWSDNAVALFQWSGPHVVTLRLIEGAAPIDISASSTSRR
jgi:hypothetical protein